MKTVAWLDALHAHLRAHYAVGQVVDLPQRDICAVMGCTRNTVKKHLANEVAEGRVHRAQAPIRGAIYSTWYQLEVR